VIWSKENVLRISLVPSGEQLVDYAENKSLVYNNT
jgi:hypothetical protein